MKTERRLARIASIAFLVMYPCGNGSGLRVRHPAEEEDTAGAIVSDKEDERMVRAKNGRADRSDGCYAYDHTCRGGGLGALFVDLDEGLVNHR